MMNKELMSKIVNRLQIKPGIILLHHNADLDAVGSALALKFAYPSYSIGALQNISQISKRFLKHFENITVLQKPSLDQFKTIVILDSSTPSQVGISPDLYNELIVIDHHVRSESWKTDLYYCDDSKTSCAEIIFELLEFINISITSEIALALSVAILADTGHFKYATHETFMNYARLLKLGGLRISKILEMVENTESLTKSQRIAQLKGAQRLRFQQVNGYLVASSILSSYEASMCKHLLLLGADVAFVGAQREEQIRISARAVGELVEKGLHLGEFLKSLASELLCEGGGHDGAAGLNGSGDVEMALNACMNKISEILKKIK